MTEPLKMEPLELAKRIKPVDDWSEYDLAVFRKAEVKALAEAYIRREEGVEPKYTDLRGWRCGHCGISVEIGGMSNFCRQCGTKIAWRRDA